MAWTGSLHLDYRRDLHGPGAPCSPRTVSRSRHDGPLRALASLYPEAPTVCHNVLVHPPGGLVGGDALTIHVQVGDGAHALITTPGATRYYRSTGSVAAQHLDAEIAAGARFEWLPLETIAYSGCLATNTMRFDIAPGGEMIGWDILALGLPASGKAFRLGRYTQSIEISGRWLERGVIDGADARLLDSPVGWAGHRALGTLWFCAGSGLDTVRREALLDAARGLVGESAKGQADGGATAVDPAVVVVRVLAPRVEPVTTLLKQIWKVWRRIAWQIDAGSPRIWQT